MQKKKFKDIELSRLGMGNMRLPVKEGGEIDFEKASEIIGFGMANGINYYDTAYVYHGGKSESFLGDALVGKYPRDSFYIATKYAVFASEDYKVVFEEQLSRLKTDYIDFYLIHGINDGVVQKYIDLGCIEYFAEQKKLGRIKYLGFSSHASAENLEMFASLRDWDFAQIQLNCFDWLFGGSKREYEILSEKNIPIMVMEPVRGGRLASLTPEAEELLRKEQPDRSVASWALRYVKRLPQVQVILSGMSSLEQIKDNTATFYDEAALTESEAELFEKACGMFREKLVVPCTACRYCCDGCPAEINIPSVLEIYNRYKTDGDWALDGLKNIDSKGKHTDCVACRACEGVCPQGIKVADIMNELAEKKK